MSRKNRYLQNDNWHHEFCDYLNLKIRRINMESEVSDNKHRRNWKTVKQLAAHNPAFSEAALRYHLFNREANGLKKHVRQIGRKLLIDEYGFVNEWIEDQSHNA